MSRETLVAIVWVVFALILVFAPPIINKKEISEKSAQISSQQEIIESLRAEIKTYQAIGNIIDSRCVDVMEPRPMEVGE